MFRQRTFLIDRLKEKRETIEALISKVPLQKEIYTGWTIKELVAHMSGWDDVIIEALQAHTRGEPISTTVTRGVDAYNASTVHTRESLDFDHVLREWRATREVLIQTLNELPDEKFNQALTFPWGEPGTVAYLLEIFVEHEEFHGRHLAEWLQHPDEPVGEH